ncbi:sperm-egg fusion protein TMEM95 isoform X1 [Leopardus geoffroyi]|uniref:sperm-egg fusion protein TMEM95 isoform X1 n=1 Tax=Leopardus geoffroyi TaxID=46844 RepID=UPI001E25D45C|nr:sperm-egg fusion protein TMEM95 isoform X1 [Leopardus geoffroyi]
MWFLGPRGMGSSRTSSSRWEAGGGGRGADSLAVYRGSRTYKKKNKIAFWNLKLVKAAAEGRGGGGGHCPLCSRSPAFSAQSSSGPQFLGPLLCPSPRWSGGAVPECSRTPAVPEQSRTSGQRVGSRIEAFQAFPAYMGPASLCHPLAGLMWTLALGGVFLATGQACVLCHLSDRDLSGRLARLCNQAKARWETCEASWTFPAFALDEVSTNKVIEKTHRVLRVMEIKGSPSSLPLYWQWLQKVKFPEYTREAFCAPACRSHDLREARILLLSVFITVLLLGVLSLVVESRHFKA